MLLSPAYWKIWKDNVNRMGEDGKELQTYRANNKNKTTRDSGKRVSRPIQAVCHIMHENKKLLLCLVHLMPVSVSETK
jgi:hypothetical protein